MKYDIEKMKEWCWLNLEFTNNPETWEDTYIVDIINDYNETCHTIEGKVMTYQQIRNIFELESEKD